MFLIAGFNFIRGKIGNRGKAARVPGRDGFYEDGDRRTCERNRPPQDRQPAVTICSSRRARPKVTTDINGGSCLRRSQPKSCKSFALLFLAISKRVTDW